MRGVGLTILNVIHVDSQISHGVYAYAYEIRNDSYLYLLVLVLCAQASKREPSRSLRVRKQKGTYEGVL